MKISSETDASGRVIATYFQILLEDVEHTKPIIEGAVNVDYDSKGRVRGIEILDYDAIANNSTIQSLNK